MNFIPLVRLSTVACGRVRNDCADTAWQNALKNAKLPNVHCHGLRHTAASHLRMQGVDLLTLQELLGHKDGRMIKRYAHADLAHRLAAVETLERAYRLPAPEGQKESP